MREVTLSLTVLFTLVVAGCFGDPSKEGRVEVYPVTGTVKVSGAAVADANVVFGGEEGQPAAIGRTNANGEFTLTTYDAGDGAAAGNYTVVVTKSAAPAPSTDPEAQHAADPSGDNSPDHGAAGAGAETEGGGSLIPRPSTPLKATVVADGDNHFDLVIE